MGWWKYAKDSLAYISVEPIILLFFWSLPYIDHGNGVLLFRYFCGANYNETFCKNISKPPLDDSPENHAIQGQVSHWIMYSKVTMVIPMLYSTTILGAISDRFQRKLPMVIPAIGVFIACIWLMSLALLHDAYKINVSSYFLVSSFLLGITGYYGSALMSTSAYLGVITTSHSRTWRISIFEAALTLGLVAGSMTSGLIIDHLDLPALFGITAGLNMIAVIYTVVRIAETHTIKSERPLWHELCEFSHVKGYIQTVYKPRAQSRRLYIHLMFASFMVGTCSSQGLFDVLFLYLTKSRSFTNSLFSLFTGSQAMLQSIGNILAMYLLKKLLSLTEPMITVWSTLGMAISYSMISASSNVVIWLSLIFIGTGGLSGGACRGFLSKLVPEEEQGQVFAFVAMGQCMTGLIASVIFNNIYPHTLGIFDGLCPLIAGIMNVLGITLALAVFIHRRLNGNDDAAMDLTSPETSAISSYSSTATASTAEMSSDDEDAFKASKPAVRKEADIRNHHLDTQQELQTDDPSAKSQLASYGSTD